MRYTLTSFALLALTAAALAQDAGITPLQVIGLRRVLAVEPSPDGRTLAFTRLEPRRPDDQPGPAYVSLWALADGRERLLVGGKQSVRGVAWTPDGASITFVQKRDAPHAEVFALPMDGGEPRRVTVTAHGVDAYAWRPDGKALAFTATDPPDPATEKARKAGFEPVLVDEDWRPLSLWLFDTASNRPTKLTERVSVLSFEWSPAGDRIVAVVAPRPLVDDSYMFGRLSSIDPATGAVTRLVDNPGKLGDWAFAPDGKSIAYVSAADRRDPHAGMLYVTDLAGRTRSLSDGYEGMYQHLVWREQGRIEALVHEGVRTALCTVDPTTGARTMRLAQDALEITSFARSAHGTWGVASTPQHPPEVFRLDGDGARRATDSNPWLANVRLGRQTVERFRARDGLEIEGLLIEPLGRAADRPLPLVIVVHGGPESHFSHGWLTGYGNLGQLLAARGYWSWYPNYRASTGRGVAFAKADHGDPMGREFEDHLDAIAHFAGRGLIDPQRVGIAGGSYGGYTAAWAATRHTEHFACAVSFVPFTDIRTKWYTSDIPSEFYFVHYEEKWPHEQREFLDSRSPLTFAERCRTPLLLAGGTSDPRVHPSQPFMLYRAVQTATKTPVRYVQYPGEGHGNRTNVHQYDYCLRALQWFDHYLGEGAARDRAPPPKALDYGEWLGQDR
jgi:dipeptidyl aminopeptidase/acylaminoacyl peptidase